MSQFTSDAYTESRRNTAEDEHRRRVVLRGFEETAEYDEAEAERRREAQRGYYLDLKIEDWLNEH